MYRALLCCLLVLLTACATTPAQPTQRPGAVATPTGTPTRVATATATRAIVAVVGRTCPDGLSWSNCFATAEAAGTATFLRPTARVAGGASPTPPSDELAVVTRVIDGSTIEVRFKDGRVETVRYIGVGTPGMAGPSASNECSGAEASARNAALVGGREVRLERDVSERDRNERLLRYVWVAGDDGATRMANAELIRSGLASAVSSPPDVRYDRLLFDAEREAREAGRSRWEVCAGVRAPTATPTATATSVPAVPTPTTQAVPPTPVPAIPSPTRVSVTATQVPPTPTRAPVIPTPTIAPAIPTATRAPVAQPTATRVPVPAPTATTRGSACHPSYPTLCLPGSPDLDCADIPQKRFPVRPPDPHGLDGDRDGIGCEN